MGLYGLHYKKGFPMIDIESLKKTFTIDSFLTNPTGEPGEATSKRKIMLDHYRNKLHNMIRDGKRFKFYHYHVGDSLYIKIQVPSETYEDLYYDVLIRFINTDTSMSSVLTENIQMISNAPSFVYSYAYSFHMMDVLVDDLRHKLGKKATKDLPVVRNPEVTLFYEKTITLALLYIKDNNLTNITKFRSSILRLGKSNFRKTAMENHDRIMKQYEEARKASVANRKALKRTRATSKAGLLTKNSLNTPRAAKNKIKKVSIEPTNSVDMKVKNSKANMKVEGNKSNMKVNMKV